MRVIHSLPKRLLAFFLALLTCLALLPFSAIQTAQAATGDTAVVDHFETIGRNYVIQPYIQGLPANSRFAQYQGVVHDEFNLAYISVNGGAPQMAYCLEYGVDLRSGTNMSSTIYESLSQDQKRLIILAGMFGYNQFNASDPNWRFYTYGLDAALASQIMVWQIVEGTFDSSTTQTVGVEAEVMHSLSASANGSPQSVTDVYQTLKSLVVQARTIPSFLGRSELSAPSYTLNWNATNNRYETVLTDTSGVLDYYDFYADGLMHQNMGNNQLLVWTNQSNLTNVVSTATCNLQEFANNNVGGFWSVEADFWDAGSRQDLVSYHPGQLDPIQGFARFSVEQQGNLRIVKTAEDGNVADIRMHISGNGIEQDVTTGPDGAVQIDHLTPGIYTVTEYPSENYAPQPAQTVTVAAGQTAEVQFHNVLVRGSVSGLKVDRETGDTIAGATFGIFAPDETEFTEETSLLEPAVTGEDGTFTFGNLLYGSYLIRELEPAPGYLPNETTYPVSITENGQVVEITVVNDQVPEIGTEATVDGEKETHPFEQVTLTDTVSYRHLVPGQEYTITGVLMDKSTGEAFLVDGEEITSEVTFVPEEANGEVEIEFTFDASGITVDTDLVAFETLSQDGVELAVHADIEDEDQTVTVKVPEIGTEATVEGGKETHPFDQVILTDTVSYTGLIPGQEYTITGVLMDKATGEAFLVDGEDITSEVTFTPEEANGTVEAEFTFDASGITVNTDLVAFETLSQDGIELAVHADIEDEGQTVTVKVPDLHTTATVGGGKDAVKGGTVTIEDVVDYTGLIPGKEYTITGVLMDKSTGQPFLVNGEQVTSEVTFTPEAADGSVKVTFTFDTSAITDDTSVVVFETLYQNGTELTTHADINDQAQTVTITVPAPVPQTGDSANLPIALALGGLLLSLAAGGIIFFLLRRKQN